MKHRLIDCNAALGHWPFRLLRHNTPSALLAILEQVGITQAWVASLDAVLHREPKSANVALAAAVEPFRGRLVPFAVINPALPSWERDIDYYCDELGLAGFRLYPNYHGYRLDSPEFEEVLACAEERDVPVQIAVRVADERMHHPLVKVPAVEIIPFLARPRPAKETTIIWLNLRQPEFPPVIEWLRSHPRGFIEISHLEIIAGLERLLRQVPAEQVLFGTHAPLLYPHSAAFKLKESDLPPAARNAILCANAERILAGNKE